MLTYLLFRFFLTVPVTGAVTGADVAAPVVAQVDKQPAAAKPVAVAVEKPSADAIDPRGEMVESPRVAQVRLAETLGTADAIHLVSARGSTITFTITRGDSTLALVATTKKGEVMSLSITPTSAPAATDGLSWLADEMQGITAITRLVPDEDGAVTLTTDDGRRYMLMPGRGSGGASDGNAAAASRFAGDFDHT